MPFWLARFWFMKFIFLERGGKMWFVGKNPTKFGLRNHEIWPFEVHKFLKLNWSYLDNHTWDLRVLGLFENGRTRPSTFMLGKNSFGACIMMQVEDQEVSIFGSWNYRSSFYFGKFSDLLQILSWCWFPWHMRPIRTWISSFKPFPSIKSKESTTVDQLWLSRASDWLCTSDEFQTLIPWDFDFKWCPKTYELLIIDHGAQIPQEWPPSTALIWLLTV